MTGNVLKGMLNQIFKKNTTHLQPTILLLKLYSHKLEIEEDCVFCLINAIGTFA